MKFNQAVAEHLTKQWELCHVVISLVKRYLFSSFLSQNRSCTALSPLEHALAGFVILSLLALHPSLCSYEGGISASGSSERTEQSGIMLWLRLS